MSFVSYAQNFEDVMLWRALRHVENGTYVDVGAQDPVVDSVSRAFYERGWRGIHIEPVPYYAERLRRDRPGEIVLQAALGERAGTLALTVIPGTGLSTAVAEHAQRHREAGFEAEEVHVPLLTLGSALGMLAGRELHWLKIDVEGFEEAVLKGWDSSLLRPWIMVVEATVPGTTDTDYTGWEPIVLSAGYRFVYFDGLNRFYVADEHAELAGAFATPPNVFDDVQLSGQASWGLYRRVAAAQRSELAQARAEAARELGEARAGAALEQERLLARVDALQEQLAQAGRDAQAAARAREEQAGRLAALEGALAQLRGESEAAARQLEAARAETHAWWSAADGAHRALNAIRESNSWRVTAPLRAGRKMLGALPGAAARIGASLDRQGRVALRPLLLRAVRAVLDRPRLRGAALRVLAGFPALSRALRGFAGRAGAVPAAAPAGRPARPVESTGLARRAWRIYGQLKKHSDGTN